MVIKNCVVCGKEFDTKSRLSICSTDCKIARKREYNEKNKERIRLQGLRSIAKYREKRAEATRQWRLNNIEKRKAISKEWYLKNKERKLSQDKERHKRNRETENPKKIEYYHKNKARLQEAARIWRSKNTERSLESKRKNRIRTNLTKMLFDIVLHQPSQENAQ